MPGNPELEDVEMASVHSGTPVGSSYDDDDHVPPTANGYHGQQQNENIIDEERRSREFPRRQVQMMALGLFLGY